MSSKTPVFGVRVDLLKALMAGPEWRAKWEKAEKLWGTQRSHICVYEIKGYKAKTVDI